MYKLLSTSESEMTRYVKLENCKTGSIELCFDDSDVCSNGQKDFWFMKIGGMYECKILLFDSRIVPSKIRNENCTLCEWANKKITVGNLEVIQVEANGDVYYVANKDIGDIENKNEFLLSFSRKDLIQVNEIILPRLL